MIWSAQARWRSVTWPIPIDGPRGVFARGQQLRSPSWAWVQPPRRSCPRRPQLARYGWSTNWPKVVELVPVWSREAVIKALGPAARFHRFKAADVRAIL